MTENDEQSQPKFGAAATDGLELLRLFMTIESQYDRDQIMDVVRAYVKALEDNGLEDKPLKPDER